jgi:hypothetical protein
MVTGLISVANEIIDTINDWINLTKDEYVFLNILNL